jgi:hypothetical protein
VALRVLDEGIIKTTHETHQQSYVALNGDDITALFYEQLVSMSEAEGAVMNQNRVYISLISARFTKKSCHKDGD